MTQQLKNQLQSAIAYSGLNTVGRQLAIEPITLAVFLLSPDRSTPPARAKIAEACARRADVLARLQPSPTEAA